MSQLNDAIFSRYNHAQMMHDAREGERIIRSTPRPKQFVGKVLFAIGDTLYHTGTGKYNAGHSMQVTEVSTDYGYYGYPYYRDEDGNFHEQSHLRSIR
jgi:hypothetical protein